MASGNWWDGVEQANDSFFDNNDSGKPTKNINMGFAKKKQVEAKKLATALREGRKELLAHRREEEASYRKTTKAFRDFADTGIRSLTKMQRASESFAYTWKDRGPVGKAVSGAATNFSKKMRAMKEEAKRTEASMSDAFERLNRKLNAPLFKKRKGTDMFGSISPTTLQSLRAQTVLGKEKLKLLETYQKVSMKRNMSGKGGASGEEKGDSLWMPVKKQAIDLASKAMPEMAGAMSEIAAAAAEAAPAIAAIVGGLILLEKVVEGIFKIDEATEHWTKSMGDAYGRVQDFEGLLSKMSNATSLDNEKIREMADAGLAAGLAMGELNGEIADYIMASGKAVKLWDVSSEVMMQWVRNERETGKGFDAISASLDDINSRMIENNLTITDQQMAMKDATYEWRKYGFEVGKSQAGFTKGQQNVRMLFKAMNMDSAEVSKTLDNLYGSFGSRLTQARFTAAMTGGSVSDAFQLQRDNPEQFLERKYQGGLKQMAQAVPDFGSNESERRAKYGDRFNDMEMERAHRIEAIKQRLGAQGFSDEESERIPQMFEAYLQKHGGLTKDQDVGAQIDKMFPKMIQEFRDTAGNGKTLAESMEALRMTGKETMNEMGRRIGNWVHDIAALLRAYIPPIARAVAGLTGGITEPDYFSDDWRKPKPAGGGGFSIPGLGGGGGGSGGGRASLPGSGSTPLVGSGKTNANARKLLDFYMSKGLTKEGAAALVGNEFGESGLSSSSVEKATGGGRGGMRPGVGYGLMQWTTQGRQSGLAQFARSRGKDVSDFDTQMEYSWLELQNYPGVLEKLKKSHNLSDASFAVMHDFEAPLDRVRGGVNDRLRNKYSSEALSLVGDGPASNVIAAAPPVVKAPAIKPMANPWMTAPTTLAPPPQSGGGNFGVDPQHIAQIAAGADIIASLLKIHVQQQAQAQQAGMRNRMAYDPDPQSTRYDRSVGNH